MGRWGMLDRIDEVDVRDAPLPGAGIGRSLMRFSEHAFRIRGRASRCEYWWWMLVHASVIVMLFGVIPAVFGVANQQVSVSLAGPFAPIQLAEWSSSSPDEPIPAPVAIAAFVGLLWGVATLIPSVTVAVRRLHDANFSGFWLLIAGLPFGPFVLILMLARASRGDGERFDC